MADDPTIVQHDTGSPIEFDLSDKDGPVDLSLDTVKIIMRKGALVITGACEKDPDQAGAGKGKGRYWPVPEDVAVAGRFKVQFQRTHPNGKTTTHPSAKPLTLTITPDLED